jgi:hypothetical protein
MAGCAVLAPLDGLTGGVDSGAAEEEPVLVDAGDATSSIDDGATGADAPLVTDAGPGDVVVVDVISDAGTSDTGGSTCADGGIRCGGKCVDPATDPSNCNGCGKVCGSGICGTSISASMTSAPALWSFNGNAFYNSSAPSAELTREAQNQQAGTFVYANAIAVTSMSVSFSFRIGLNGGLRSDGMGFMMQQGGANAVGAPGAGLGMAGLTGFGVELDIYDNGVCSDSNGNHVGIDDLSICDPQQGSPTSLAEQDVTSTLDLGDAHWHSAVIKIGSGGAGLTIDGTSVLSATPLIGFKSGTAYNIGFSGGTGGLVGPNGSPGGYRQEVKNIVVSFPTPQCLRGSASSPSAVRRVGRGVVRPRLRGRVVPRRPCVDARVGGRSGVGHGRDAGVDAAVGRYEVRRRVGRQAAEVDGVAAELRVLLQNGAGVREGDALAALGQARGVAPVLARDRILAGVEAAGVLRRLARLRSADDRAGRQYEDEGAPAHHARARWHVGPAEAIR